MKHREPVVNGNKTKNSARAVSILLLSWILTVNANAMTDDEMHFTLSAVAGSGCETALSYATDIGSPGRFFLGTALGTIPGLVKEIMDSTKSDNSFSGSDMQADILGAATGALLGNLFNNFVHFSLTGKDLDTLKISFEWEF